MANGYKFISILLPYVAISVLKESNMDGIAAIDCGPPVTYSYVFDQTGLPLCSVINGSLQVSPVGVTRAQCGHHCASVEPRGCYGYTYYEEMQRCEVLENVSRNYVIRDDCMSYRVENFKLFL